MSDPGTVLRLALAQVNPTVGDIDGNAALAVEWIGRARDAHKNRRVAALWLIGVALLALAITYANESWLTLENLKGHGTYRSSAAWPDTKKLSLVADLVALAAGIAALVYRPKSNLPKATLRAS